MLNLAVFIFAFVVGGPCGFNEPSSHTSEFISRDGSLSELADVDFGLLSGEVSVSVVSNVQAEHRSAEGVVV